MKLEIVRAAFQTTVQDLGRAGFRRSGVSAGGSLDPAATRIANLLVGNPESAAVLELASAGLHVRFTDERIAAWCGAPFEVSFGERRVPAGRPFRAAAGDSIVFRAPASGMRAWLAISGGIDVVPVLGSRSTDLRANFGGFEGRTLSDGDLLPLGEESREARRLHTLLKPEEIAAWGAGGESAQTALEPVLRVVRGREWVRFGIPAQTAFFDQSFVVLPDSDRMGLRLTGPALRSVAHIPDLTSEAVVAGTIQVPPEGRPIVLLADCQTIGGYPKIAHVITVDLARAAQLRPGEAVRFRETSLDEARALRIAAERAIERFRLGLNLRFG